jgi:geranylgeranyl diphosphate synthase, type I
MNRKYARSDLPAPLGRIDAAVDRALEGLRAYGRSPMWGAAVSAVLATHRAPKHLVRAQLVLLGSRAGGGPAEGDAIERFAAGVELFHLFMLVHDDVMDHATLRRGEPALRVALRAAEPEIAWETASDMAIVVGNAVALLAMRHLAPGGGEGAHRACERILDGGLHAGAGQMQDLAGFRGLGDGEGALRGELVAKTAYHSFAAPFAAGLTLANADADVTAALGWGERVGVAFQALDDLTDLVAPPKATGKDALRDLLEGRPSLPLLLLRERTSGGDRAFLASLEGRKVLEPGDRAHLDELIERTSVIAECEARIRKELDEASAIASAAGFPEAAVAGMRAVEKSLSAHLDQVIAAAREAE